MEKYAIILCSFMGSPYHLVPYCVELDQVCRVVALRLFRIVNEPVTAFFPSINPSSKNLDVPVAFFYVFYCHTGSGRFLRSASVKDDFLITAQFREFTPLLH
jgi:hypothetical protein